MWTPTLHWLSVLWGIRALEDHHYVLSTSDLCSSWNGNLGPVCTLCFNRDVYCVVLTWKPLGVSWPSMSSFCYSSPFFEWLCLLSMWMCRCKLLTVRNQALFSFLCSLQWTLYSQCSLWDSMSEQQDQVSKSSCSSISTSTQGSEDDGTVGALLTEAKTNGRSLGKRLSHLDSLPVLIYHLLNVCLSLFFCWPLNDSLKFTFWICSPLNCLAWHETCICSTVKEIGGSGQSSSIEQCYPHSLLYLIIMLQVPYLSSTCLHIKLLMPSLLAAHSSS